MTFLLLMHVPPVEISDNLPQLETQRKISPNPKDWRCEESGVAENLWLNLSTGFIGSGRQVGCRSPGSFPPGSLDWGGG